VPDGVLYHESDLDLEEHYTDTHGYTEINFAAFGMVGMRFCPRIRSLHRQRIYCADPGCDHGVLEPVLRRRRRAVKLPPRRRAVGPHRPVLREAFPAGYATASAALQRLNRFQASNRFYAANRELGRALKTEFVLQHVVSPVRARVKPGARQLVRRGSCLQSTTGAPGGCRRRDFISRGGSAPRPHCG